MQQPRGAELVLMRHAEDLAASAGFFGDTGLSAQGVSQAKDRGEQLAALELTACWVSPLERAQQTADLVLDDRPIARRTLDILAEGQLGALDGLSYAAAHARYPDDFLRGRSVVARIAASARTAPGGEPREAFLTRAEHSARLFREHLDSGIGRVLVVSHGGLLNYALQFLTDMPVRDEATFGFDHCGTVRVQAHFEPPSFGPFVMLRF